MFESRNARRNARDRACRLVIDQVSKRLALRKHVRRYARTFYARSACEATRSHPFHLLSHSHLRRSLPSIPAFPLCILLISSFLSRTRPQPYALRLESRVRSRHTFSRIGRIRNYPMSHRTSAFNSIEIAMLIALPIRRWRLFKGEPRVTRKAESEIHVSSTNTHNAPAHAPAVVN